ncbi:MAG: gliding motility-associated C-terminal domain-containing protein [Bacteroidota bacterium]
MNSQSKILLLGCIFLIGQSFTYPFLSFPEATLSLFHFFEKNNSSNQMEELCDNGMDDDGDGLIDIFDEDCQCQATQNSPNLVPNGDFETADESCCTRSTAGGPICVDGWTHAYSTPDFVNDRCIINTERQLFDVPLVGNFFGLILRYFNADPDSPLSRLNGISTETIGRCLPQTLTAGKTYLVFLDVGRKLRLQDTSRVNEDFFLTLNGITECDSLYKYETGRDFCDKDLPYETIIAANLLQVDSGWTNFTYTFQPTTDINAIFFSGDCNNLPETSQSLIALVDNLLIQELIPPAVESPSNIADSIRIDGGNCEGVLRFTVDGAEDLAIHWYKDSIPLIRTTGGSLLFSPQMLANAAGMYHAKVTLENGDCILVGPLNYQPKVLTNTISTTIEEGQTYFFAGQNLTESGTYEDIISKSVGCDSIVTLNLTVIPFAGEICGNGIDDDGNGLVDVFDPVCACNSPTVNPSNLIPNSGFDEVERSPLNCGPVISSQTTNIIEDWFWISGNPDYYDSSCGSAFRDGNRLLLGTYMGSVFVGSASGSDSEAMGTCLDAPLLPNQRYEISLEGIFQDLVRRDDEDLFFTVYGVPNCVDLVRTDSAAALGFCEKGLDQFPLFSFSMNDFIPGEKQIITGVISNLTQSFSGIILAGDCAQTPTQNSVSYMAIDQVTLTPIVAESSRNWSFDQPIAVEGSLCADEVVTLSVPFVDSLQYRWYLDSLPIDEATSNHLTIPVPVLFSRNAVHVEVRDANDNCQLIPYFPELPVVSTSTTSSFCAGTTLNFGQYQITEAGVYVDTFSTASGCDSIVTLQATVIAPILGDTLIAEQPVGAPYNFNGNAYTESGLYEATLTAEDGCDSLVFLQLTVTDPCATGISLQIETANPSCEAATNGWIDLFMDGANPPFEYSIDGGITFSNQSTFENLSSNTYSVLVEDAAGCTTTEVVDLPPLSVNLQVDLPKDTIVDFGTTVNVEAVSFNFVPKKLQWTTDATINCTDCLSPTIRPTTSTSVQLLATDEFGCFIRDSFLIEVRPPAQFYVPNVFSPNNDGQNEVFQIGASPDHLQKVQRLSIFNRWGNLIFDQTPNESTSILQWDGSINGTPANSGAYVYVITWLDKAGKLEQLVGDLMLVR